MKNVRKKGVNERASRKIREKEYEISIKQWEKRTRCERSIEPMRDLWQKEREQIN
jgi:hypothetical protein